MIIIKLGMLHTLLNTYCTEYVLMLATFIDQVLLECDYVSHIYRSGLVIVVIIIKLGMLHTLLNTYCTEYVLMLAIFIDRVLL